MVRVPPKKASLFPIGMRKCQNERAHLDAVSYTHCVVLIVCGKCDENRNLKEHKEQNKENEKRLHQLGMIDYRCIFRCPYAYSGMLKYGQTENS